MAVTFPSRSDVAVISVEILPSAVVILPESEDIDELFVLTLVERLETVLLRLLIDVEIVVSRASSTLSRAY